MVIVSKNRYFAKLPTTITIKLTLKDWNFPSIEGRCQSSQNTVSEEIGPGWAPELTASTFKEVSPVGCGTDKNRSPDRLVLNKRKFNPNTLCFLKIQYILWFLCRLYKSFASY